jgi:hypothetical protein
MGTGQLDPKIAMIAFAQGIMKSRMQNMSYRRLPRLQFHAAASVIPRIGEACLMKFGLQ